MTSTDPTRPDVLLVTASSVRTSANECAAAFLRWTHRTVPRPPRAYALAGGQLKHELRDAGVKVVETPRSPLRTVERLLLKAGKPRAARRVRKVLHRFLFGRPPRPDVVLAVGVPGAGPVLKHLHPDTRLLTYCYETGPVLDELVDEAMLDRLVRRTDGWVAATDEIAADLVGRGVAADAVTTVRPFIDGPHIDRSRSEALRRSLDPRPGEVVVGGFGASRWEDGPDLFIRTAAILRREHPELRARFVWVGAPDDGPSRWILDHDVRHAGLEDVVTFTGSIEEVDSWVAALDVLLVTSRVDPPPPHTLQAGAVGVPVVGFALDGLVQLARDVGGAPAIQAVEYLDVAAMADAVVRLVGDEELRTRGGADLQQQVLGHQLTHDAAPQLWRTVLAVASGEPIGTVDRSADDRAAIGGAS